MRKVLSFTAMVTLFPAAATGQEIGELLARMRQMEERINALEEEVRSLKSQPAPQAPAAITTPTPSGSLPYYGGASALSKIFNPDMSVIGTFLGSAGSGAVGAIPALQMTETEVALQAIVDPYARADFFLSFGERGAGLEEGYLTFPALPGGLQLRAGKMRAAFGKVNLMHLDSLPWADRPLATQNLLGGDEGISDAGVSVSRILPAPGKIFLEATGQVFRGEVEDLFVPWRRGDVAAVGHVRGYRDLTESTNLELGASYARGPSPEGPSLLNRLYGVDATLRWKPLRRSIYRSFLGRSELVWARTGLPEREAKAFGYYVSGEYQFARRWRAGGRFDRSDQMAFPFLRDTGASLLLTYRPSEFSPLRGQLRRTRFGGGVTANEFLIQLQFSLGVHGAHPF